MNVFIIQVGAVVSAIVCGGSAHAQQTATDPPATARVRVTWGETPSIRFGTIARVDLRLTLQADARDSDVSLGPDASNVSWARKRFGLGGVVAGAIGFQIDHEFSSGGVWRDVYLNYQQFEAIQIRAGQFKIPFSRDELTSPAHMDFVFRSRAAETIAPGRDRGVMAHGRVLDGALGYELGVFEHDGENARRPSDGLVHGGRTVAARVTARPFGSARTAARTVEVGGAAVWTDLAEGLTSLQGETPFGHNFYQPVLWVRGPQHRQGAEFRWRPGPFSANAEYLRLTAERRNQSVEDTDLSPFLTSGWYVSGTWILTGEGKVDGPERPRRPVPRGPGAIEAVVRVEALEFSSGASDDAPSTSPRADVVLGNRFQAVTLGVNWYPIRWVRVQFNLIRQSLDDPSQGPLPAQTAFWDRLFRVQFHW